MAHRYAKNCAHILLLRCTPIITNAIVHNAFARHRARSSFSAAEFIGGRTIFALSVIGGRGYNPNSVDFRSGRKHPDPFLFASRLTSR
jgi:hypothetical protein